MAEKPLDRLSYYNGQRLEADDLTLEQEYHIRVRRWLNKSLYPEGGIVDGLEVTKLDDLQVIVEPGLALDPEGREIILMERRVVPVIPKKNRPDGRIPGNYLTIRYDEETTSEEGGSCTPRPEHPSQAVSRAAWGGPGRVRAAPRLGWTDATPTPGGNEVYLAQIELDAACTCVKHIHRGVREDVERRVAQKVFQYALEGTADIAVNVPKRIYFHIRGRQPNAVTLYLRGSQFCPFHYTELPEHSHDIAFNGSDYTIDLNSVSTTEDSAGTPDYTDVTATVDRSVWSIYGTLLGGAIGSGTVGGPTYGTAAGGFVGGAAGLFFSNLRSDLNGAAFVLSPARNLGQTRTFNSGPDWDGDNEPDFGISVDIELPQNYSHVTVPITINFQEDSLKHHHGLTGDATISRDSNASGASYSVGTKPVKTSSCSDFVSGLPRIKDPKLQPERYLQYTYLGKMEILVDDVDITSHVLKQLKDNDSTNWNDSSTLGNGQCGHRINNRQINDGGTGAIRLDFITGVDLVEGEHVIELRVAKGGGRINYNLYVD